MAANSVSKGQLVEFLSRNIFVYDLKEVEENKISFTLNLKKDAIEIFVNSLSSEIRKFIEKQITPEKHVFIIYLNESELNLIKHEFSIAFKVVSEYLEYLELSKDYASGAIPKHLSAWLLYSRKTKD
jgi:hypothetical protein